MSARSFRSGIRRAFVLLALATCVLAPAASRPAECATLLGMQTGQITIAGNQLFNTATITAVTPSKTILFTSISENEAAPLNGAALCQLLDATTIRCERKAQPANPITIRYYAAEFSSGVTVQRGTASVTGGNGGAVKNVTIAAVNPSQAFIVLGGQWRGTDPNGDGAWNFDNFMRARLTSATNLEFLLDQNYVGSSTKDVHWQVVSFDTARVQRPAAPVAFAGNSTQLDVALPTAIDTTRSFLLFSYTYRGDFSSPGAAAAMGQILNTTTLRFTRGLAGTSPADDISIAYEVVSVPHLVQQGVRSFAAAAGSAAVPLAVPVNTAGAVAFSGSQASLSQSLGRTTDNAWADPLGVTSFTHQISGASNLTLARANTSFAAEVGWFVVDFTPPALYYSVGTSTALLYNGDASASMGTLTLAAAAANNIGVGDQVCFGNAVACTTADRYYINGRLSPTVFTIQNSAANGGAPGATNITFASQSITIRRAFNSLAAAEAGSPNASHLNTTDLVAHNYQLNWPCYGDGDDTAAVTVAGWTTGPSNYIRIYTPVSSSEVGTSQRHSGTWNSTSAYRLQADPGGAANAVLLISTNYVHVEGLQVWMTSDKLNQEAIGVTGITGLSSYDITDNIVRGNGVGTQSSRTGVALWGSTGAAGSTARIWNNVVYDFGGSGADVGGMRLDDPAFTFHAYNNTVVGNVQGIARYQGTVVAKNDLAYGNTDNYSGTFDATSTNNLSGPGADPQIPATNARSGVIVTFVNAAGYDFHLAPGDTGARAQGADLSADPNLAFGADIDGGVRTAPWDIGADEVSTTADLQIVKDDGQATAVPGTGVTYTITVRNNGPGPVTSVLVNDPVPAALLGPTFAPSTGTYNSGTGEWTGLNLAPTQSATLTLSGTIDPFARGTLVNSATVAPPPGGTDPNGTNDSATDTDTLSPSADLSLTKLDDLDPVGLGSVLTYTLAVANAGPSGATGVTLTDALPVGMTFESATPTQGSCAYDGPTRTLTCTLGSIAPSSNASVSLKVRPQAVGSIVNTASVVANETDPVAGNNTATQTTTVQVSSIGVRFLTVTSTSERNVLEWVNPTADYVSTEIVFRTDRYPAGPGDGTVLYNAGVAGGKEKLPHLTGAGSNGVTHYYGAFVHRSTPPAVSPGRFCSGRPFETTGPVKWAFSTGATALAPPTVGGAGVIAPSNDRILYAMERGEVAGSGEWPGTWWPIELGGVVQSRSPVVPIPVGAANPVVFLGAQDGQIYAVDAARGSKVAFPWGPTPAGPMVQAAPAGIFSAFDAALTFDYLLVGTRDSSGPNVFVALDPATGSVVGSFDNGGGASGIGIINAMAAVDYPSRRVYFTSHGGGSATTLWCLQLGPTPTVFTGCGWPTPRTLGDIDSSPVLRGGRIYVGSSAGGGTVYSIDAATGDPALDRTFVHGDGQVKGFVFPDRSSDDIYFATENLVWGVTDLAGGMSNKFTGGVSLGVGVRPSPALFVPGSHYVYVGGSDGSLHEIDVLGHLLNEVPLGDGKAGVGAPSLDRGYGLVHVGAEAGIFYAVQVPLPVPACVPAASCSAFNLGQRCHNGDPAIECPAYLCKGPAVCSP